MLLLVSLILLSSLAILPLLKVSRQPAPSPPPVLIELAKPVATLPNELIERILALLDEHDGASTSYANCRLVSRRFDRLAMPFLLARLKRLASQRTRIWRHDSAKASYIAALDLGPVSSFELLLNAPTYAPTLVWLHLGLPDPCSFYLPCLASCIHLTHLALVFPEHNLGQLGAVLEAIEPLSCLHELLLHNIQDLPPGVEIRSWPSSSLKRLLLRNLVDTDSSPLPLRAFHPPRCTLTHLTLVDLPIDLAKVLATVYSAALTHLRFESNRTSDIAPDLLQVPWPCLQSLALDLGSTGPSQFVRQFIDTFRAPRPEQLKDITFADRSAAWESAQCEEVLRQLRKAIETGGALLTHALAALEAGRDLPPAEHLKHFLMSCTSINGKLLRFVSPVDFGLECVATEQLVRKAAELRRRAEEEQLVEGVGLAELSLGGCLL